MDTNLLRKIEAPYLKAELPEINVGDTVEVDIFVRDGEKKRTQKFGGLIIAKDGSGLGANITVRKISSGIGVEKILPLHSPNLGEIRILKQGKVRKSKIYYMRGRQGKQAMKVKAAK